MDLLKHLDESIEIHENNKPRRNYLGASYIGKSCDRAIWYEYTQAEKEYMDAKTARTMEIGRRLEKMIIDYINDSVFENGIPPFLNEGMEVIEESMPQFRGHIDGMLEFPDGKIAILEIKTANQDRFEKFVQHYNKWEGLASWSPTYYAQVQAYMGMSKLESCIFIVINKNTSAWHAIEIPYDADFYSELKVKAQYIIDSKEPPPRISDNPWFYCCKMCQYNKVCHGSGEDHASTD